MPLIQYQAINIDEGMPQVKTLLQVGARMYMHLSRAVLDTFGRDGEMTVRQHLRDYGKWRGSEMREAHNAMGRPINMETLLRCWDSASTFIVQDEMQSDASYSPSDVRHEVWHCPAAEAWKADDFHQWGHVYCDEFHQSAASTYHPDGMVVIPINMMKGDDHCLFHWALPGGARQVAPYPPSELGNKLAEYYEPTTPQQGVHMALLRTSRLIGGRYWTMARAILDRHPGPAGEACLRRGLRSWARQRGELLRASHIERGIDLNAVNLVRDMDLACKYVWDLREVAASPGLYEAVVEWTPEDDAWADLAAGDVARIFWEETLPVLAEAYRPDLSLDWVSLTWRGDPETRLRVTEAG